MATIVFAKVGADLSFAILSISARFSDMAAASAGLKYSTLTRSNGGTPPYGPSQLASSGLGSADLSAKATIPFELLKFSLTTTPSRAIAKRSRELRLIRVRIKQQSSFV